MLKNYSEIKNGDLAIKECPNCEMQFEEVQKVGDKIFCGDPDDPTNRALGCGVYYTFRIITEKMKTE